MIKIAKKISNLLGTLRDTGMSVLKLGWANKIENNLFRQIYNFLKNCLHLTSVTLLLFWNQSVIFLLTKVTFFNILFIKNFVCQFFYYYIIHNIPVLYYFWSSNASWWRCKISRYTSVRLWAQIIYRNWNLDLWIFIKRTMETSVWT